MIVIRLTNAKPSRRSAKATIRSASLGSVIAGRNDTAGRGDGWSAGMRTSWRGLRSSPMRQARPRSQRRLPDPGVIPRMMWFCESRSILPPFIQTKTALSPGVALALTDCGARRTVRFSPKRKQWHPHRGAQRFSFARRFPSRRSLHSRNRFPLLPAAVATMDARPAPRAPFQPQ